MAKNKFESHVAPYLDRIAQWAEQGATQAEIAEKLGLGERTFKRYLCQGERGEEPYVQLRDCFREACATPDDNVEAAMYKRACGMQWDERTYKTEWDERVGDYVEICVKRVTKYIPPDPTSAMFWLANRRRGKWSYRAQLSESAEADEAAGVIVLPEVESDD